MPTPEVESIITHPVPSAIHTRITPKMVGDALAEEEQSRKIVDLPAIQVGGVILRLHGMKMSHEKGSPTPILYVSWYKEDNEKLTNTIGDTAAAEKAEEVMQALGHAIIDRLPGEITNRSSAALHDIQSLRETGGELEKKHNLDRKPLVNTDQYNGSYVYIHSNAPDHEFNTAVSSAINDTIASLEKNAPHRKGGSNYDKDDVPPRS